MNSREKIRAYLTAPDLLRNRRNAFLMQFKARNINPYFRLLPKENLTDYLLWGSKVAGWYFFILCADFVNRRVFFIVNYVCIWKLPQSENALTRCLGNQFWLFELKCNFPSCKKHWNGHRSHLGPWLFWSPRNLVPEKLIPETKGIFF